MAITPVTLSTKFKEWKDITNEIITSLGDNTSLSTTAKDSLVNAINEIYALSGNLAALNTTAQDSLVNAINEVLAKLGDVAGLNTTASVAVTAINELLATIGTIGNLTTTNTTNLVLAINSLKSELGDLSALNTTAQGSAVAAINEAVAATGDLTTLTTTAQGSAVAAINELDGEVGDLSTLNTTAQGSLVAAINEVDTEATKIDELQYTNSEPFGGRYATDDLDTIAVSTFAGSSGLIVGANSASFAAGDNFINDNANYGGAGGSLGTDISTLVSALGVKGGRTEQRYGYEFYILDITAGANTQDGEGFATETYYPVAENQEVMLGAIGRTVTFMCWMKLKTLATPANNGIVLGNLAGNIDTYVDGVLVAGQSLLTTASGWVHVKQTITLTKEFEKYFPAIMGNSGDVIQIALPVVATANTGFGLHKGLVN